MNPLAWKKKIETYHKNTKIQSNLNEYEKDMAQLAKNSYDKNRNNHKNYHYHPELSSPGHAIYRNEETNKNYLVFKGTSDYKDITPDYSIVTGFQNYDNSFGGAEKLYQSVKDKLQGEWETVGHSLGGARAMYVAQNNNIVSHAFNPGYNNYFDDLIDTDYKKHHVYIKQGDAISNTMLTEELNNLKYIGTNTLNPLKNHSINSFVEE